MLPDLLDFLQAHHGHGDLTGDATEPAWNSYLVTVACPCGVTLLRWVTPDVAEEDMHAALVAGRLN